MTPVSNLKVQTPEGVVFAFHLASPLTRALAYAIDFSVIVVLTTILAKGVQIFAIFGADWAGAASVVFSFVASIAYSILLEWRWRGQTLGKKVMRLRVIDALGLRLEFSQVLLRNLLRAVDLLPGLYLVGGFLAFATRRCQRLGDLAAGTIVARESPRHVRSAVQIAPLKHNSLLAYPHLVARLRNQLSADVVSLAVHALSSRDSYEASARVALFKELTDYFRSLVPFPEESVGALTDEQYVRGVVTALYASRPQRIDGPLVHDEAIGARQ